MAIAEYTSGFSRDFRQRYNGVFGFYTTGSGKEILVKISDVGERQCKFVDADGDEYFAYPDKGVSFKFIPVNRKLFIHNGSLCCAQRKPARQWQRGICESNTQITNISGGFVEKIDFQRLISYLSGGKDEYFVMRISDKFGFYFDRVYLYDVRIGKKDGDTITLENSLFVQELKDAVRDAKLDIKVLCEND